MGQISCAQIVTAFNRDRLSGVKSCIGKNGREIRAITRAVGRSGPITPSLVICLEPSVAAIGCGARRADEDHAAWSDEPLQQRADPVAIHPVQRTTDRDDVKRANLARQRLGRTLYQRKVMSCAIGSSSCDLNHGRLRIHTNDPSDIRSKAEGEESRTRTKIDEGMLLAKPQPFHDSPEEFGRIRWTELLVQCSGCCETTHLTNLGRRTGRDQLEQITFDGARV